MSAGAAVTNLGSNFLERLGTQATNGFGSALAEQSGRGGASEAADTPSFPDLGEAYGISARTRAGRFRWRSASDLGGIAGLGARVAPGVMSGFRSTKAVPPSTSVGAAVGKRSTYPDRRSTLGRQRSVTWAIALVHGFGKNQLDRDTGFGIASAATRARRRCADRAHATTGAWTEPRRAERPR